MRHHLEHLFFQIFLTCKRTNLCRLRFFFAHIIFLKAYATEGTTILVVDLLVMVINGTAGSPNCW